MDRYMMNKIIQVLYDSLNQIASKKTILKYEYLLILLYHILDVKINDHKKWEKFIFFEKFDILINKKLKINFFYQIFNFYESV